MYSNLLPKDPFIFLGHVYDMNDWLDTDPSWTLWKFLETFKTGMTGDIMMYVTRGCLLFPFQESV